MKKLNLEKQAFIKKYIQIRKDIDVLTEKLDALKENENEVKQALLSLMETKDKEILDGYVVVSSTRRVYGDWPPDILEKESELKDLKEQAKRVGNITYDFQRTITCKPLYKKEPEEELA